MGGATVLKVGGQFCEWSEPKKILTPHFLASGGQNIAQIAMPNSFV